MYRLSTILYLLFISSFSYAQSETFILTDDIDHFWEAYDQLANCKTTEDSLATFQTLYIDRATEGFKVFLKARKFTAKEYIYHVRKEPQFWESIRANTLSIKEKLPELESVYAAYKEAFPNHQPPKTCFAIGTLRTAGTVHKDYLLIGTEMIATDSTTITTELTPWQQSVLPDKFEVRPIIAHEYVHALQNFGIGKVFDFFTRRVLFMTLLEGSADYLAKTIAGATINGPIHQFGRENEAAVWEQFQADVFTNKANYWVYNGGNEGYDFPADMGYFVGYQICESYYEKAKDKEQALQDILKLKHMKKFFKQSGYEGSDEQE